MVRVRVSKLLGLNFDPNPNCNFALTLIMQGSKLRAIGRHGRLKIVRGE